MLCKTCQKDLDENSFGSYRGREGKVLRRKSCRRCRSNMQSDRYAKDPKVAADAKLAARRYVLRKAYGMTQVDYDRMYEAQQGLCAICGQLPIGKPLNVDHDHRTGKVRQLLCWSCNTALGKFRDSVEILRQAVAYLERHRN